MFEDTEQTTAEERNGREKWGGWRMGKNELLKANSSKLLDGAL